MSKQARRTHGAQLNAEQAFILEERWQSSARSHSEVVQEGGEFAGGEVAERHVP